MEAPLKHLSEGDKQKFRDSGYLVIPGFLSPTEVKGLREEMSRLVTDMNPEQHQANSFKTGKEQKADDYFLTSGDKIRYFFEEGVHDANGKLTVDKHVALNKVGHALHALSPPFKKVTFSPRTKALVTDLGFQDPTVVQSMYIFKQPRVGGKVIPHRDAWFLHTQPKVRLMALWFALEDTTTENGCLWFVPGSHKEEIETQFVREASGDSLLSYTHPAPAFEDREFIAGPVAAGSVVVIDGSIIHKSESNKSHKSRHIYTFHLIDQEGVEWGEENWLQPTDTNTFLHMKDVNV